MRARRINLAALTIITIAGAAGPLSALSASAVPAVADQPAREEVVATQLLSPAIKASLRQLGGARDSGQLTAASRLDAAKRMIEGGRINGDPRMLGYAEALLEPWRDKDSAPPEALVLRATIEQARHHFARARALLDHVLLRDATHPQALLTRATVATVTGDYDRARRDCLALRLLAADAGAICGAGVDALTGAELRALQTLQIATERTQGAMRAWAIASHAQVLEQRGEADAAMKAYRASLAIEDDMVTRVALANLLFSQRRYRDAQQVLALAPAVDAVLLLRWQTGRALREPVEDLRVQLLDRFAQAASRGELVHTREAAQFALEDGRIDDALRLARDNWAVQREPADLLILTRAAHAANDSAMKIEAARWVRRTRLHDVRLPVPRGDS